MVFVPLRLVAAILPPAKRAMHAAFKLEGAMSVDSSSADTCLPHYAVWGVSLAGAALVGFGLANVLRFQLLRRALRWVVGKVTLVYSMGTYMCACVLKARPRLTSGDARSYKSSSSVYSSVHSSATAGNISGKNKDKSGHRDSTTFTYVSSKTSPGGRMSLDLCMACIETNRLMRKIASDTGQRFESEPCSLCKERASRLASFTNPSPHASSANSGVSSPSKRARGEHCCG
mmetsp:Transcript_51505/g.75337  ORF Transcript_51505/g.75337 Transcript_51505/m.75337 type:complete len:231 (-) Transcript_51505:57-749(-)